MSIRSVELGEQKTFTGSNSPIAKPTEPLSITATAGATGSGIITVGWTVNTLGAAATSFRVLSTPAGANVSGLTGSSANITTANGLVGGTSYTFQVFAVNANGESVASASSSSATHPLQQYSVTFNSSGTWTKPAGTVSAELLLVGGGGGGSNAAGGFSYAGGGGGAGGYKYTANVGALNSNTYSIVVGGGGAAGSALRGSSGGATTGFGLSTAGGGGGGYGGSSMSAANGDGGNGGSGGGGGGGYVSGRSSPGHNANGGTPSDGFAGGQGGNGADAGGGGGAAAAGSVGHNRGGNSEGGAGANFYGTSYAGGGGGANNSGTAGRSAGGIGGGGKGTGGEYPPLRGSVQGTDTLGGGGGGGMFCWGNPARGGSGTAIIRYVAP